MLPIMVAVAAAGLILFAAGRYALGWTIPAARMARIDARARAIGTTYLKAVVVLFAVAIVALIVAAIRAG